MKRKTVIKGMLGLGGLVSIGSGIKLYQWYKSPSIELLELNQALITALAETIIPTTELPGAKDADIAPSIIHLLKNIYPKTTQNKFIDGLSDVDYDALKSYNKSFIECSEAEKIEIVKGFEQKAQSLPGLLGKIQYKLTGKPFFQSLKEVTTIAFCTSKIGATKALAYDYIPGRFQGCIPLTSNQAAWATK